MRAQPPVPLEPPTLGVASDVIPPLIPAGHLWRSANVLARFGEIVNRPGYEKVLQSGPGGRITGGHYFKTPGGVRRVVAAHLTKWFSLVAGAWSDITGTAMTGTADDPVRFAVFPSSATNYLIGVNNTDSPKVWDGVAATYSNLGGSPPIARDVLVASNRVVLLNVVEAGNRAVTRIRASDFNNHAAWTSTVTYDLPDSFGEIVGGRPLGRTAFVVYCEGTAWLATTQPGTFPFRFDRLEDWPGPVSPAAIVVAGRRHYYLGNDARIYECDGLQVRPVSGRVDKDLQTSSTAAFRLVDKRRAWGLFSQRDLTIWFFYPGPTSSDPDRAVSYDLLTGAVHLHSFPVKMTAGWPGDEISTLTWDDLASFTWANVGATYANWDSFGGTLAQADFLGSAQGQVYRMRRNIDDDGAGIAMAWEYPLRPWLGAETRIRLDSIISAFEQVTGGAAVTVQAGVSEAMAEATDPTYVNPTPATHDTSAATRQVLKFDNAAGNEGQFASVKYSVTTSKQIRFKGALLHLWGEAAA